jgi:hypothetical protein
VEGLIEGDFSVHVGLLVHVMPYSFASAGAIAASCRSRSAFVEAFQDSLSRCWAAALSASVVRASSNPSGKRTASPCIENVFAMAGVFVEDQITLGEVFVCLD